MSRENVEVARLVLDAFNRRDRAAWLALNDPEVECVPPDIWPESEVVRGREAAWDFYAESIGALGEGGFDVSGEIIEGVNGKLVQQARGEVMQGTTSGVPVVLDYWMVGTFRNGKVLRVEWFTDRAEALAAVGLSE